MSISIRPVHPVFVGEVSGIDISQPLTSDQVLPLRRAWTATWCWRSVTNR